jgi:16S rRNA (uracil1498-N3)-methyltransferase
VPKDKESRWESFFDGISAFSTRGNRQETTFALMTLFFSDTIQFPITPLSDEEAHHGIRVLRLRHGATVWLTDGKGKIYEGTFRIQGSRNADVDLKADPVKVGSREFSVCMAVAPLKSNDRFEWFLEKATELGVAEIIPILCEHGERVKCNMERWERVILAAVKQSMNPFKPVLHEPVLFSEFLASNTRKTYFAHCADGPKKPLSKALGMEKDISICIGPEGDFSAAEIQLALNAGYFPVSLGDLRLRTETAALTALVLAVQPR